MPNAQTSRPRGVFSRSAQARPIPRQPNTINQQAPWAHSDFERPDLQPDHFSPENELENPGRQRTQSQPGTTRAGSPPSPLSSTPPRRSTPYQGNGPQAPYDPHRQNSTSTDARQSAQTTESQARTSPYDSYTYRAFNPPGSHNSFPYEPRQNSSARPSRPQARSDFHRTESSTSTSSTSESTSSRTRSSYARTARRNSDGGRSQRFNPPPGPPPASRSTSGGPANARSPAPTAPHSDAPVVPTLDELLVMTEEGISHLSIGSLKRILFTNHVNARNILEKVELVSRVKQLIETERREREHMARIHEAEEREQRERLDAQRREEEKRRRREMYRTTVEEVEDQEGPLPTSSSMSFAEDGAILDDAPPSANEKPEPPSATEKPKSKPPSAEERSGLCIVCQDQDANIVIIDCGYALLLLSNPIYLTSTSGTWRFVANALIWSCRAQENALFAGPVL